MRRRQRLTTVKLANRYRPLETGVKKLNRDRLVETAHTRLSTLNLLVLGLAAYLFCVHYQSAPTLSDRHSPEADSAE